MSTKAQIIERLKSLPDDAVIAVPTIWVKSSAEDMYNYMQEEEIEFTDDQWSEIVHRFEDADFYDEEALLDTIREVLEEEQ